MPSNPDGIRVQRFPQCESAGLLRHVREVRHAQNPDVWPFNLRPTCAISTRGTVMARSVRDEFFFVTATGL